MQAQATAKFVRYTPRKVNQVLSLIRGKNALKAFETLSFLPKSAATLVEKVLKSACANTGRLKDVAQFKVAQAWVCNAPIMKRMRPGPQGRGMPVKKRTSHLTIVVTDEGVSASRRKKKAVGANKNTTVLPSKDNVLGAKKENK